MRHYRKFVQLCKQFLTTQDLQFSKEVPTMEQKILYEFYTGLLPAFQHLKIRKLKLVDIDERFCEIYTEYLYPFLWIYTQFEPNYWERIKENKLTQDLEEYKVLQKRKRDLRKAWQTAYSRPSKRLMEAK